MIDASSLSEVLLATEAGKRLSARVYRDGETLHAPQLLDLEIIHVLRRGCLIGKLQTSRAAEALADLSDLRLVRYIHQPYIPRIWELRHSLTAYDAAYVALAEALDVPLITRDSRMASSHGHRAKIEVLD